MSKTGKETPVTFYSGSESTAVALSENDCSRFYEEKLGTLPSGQRHSLVVRAT